MFQGRCGCGKPWRAQANLAGRSVKCTGCNTVFQVPTFTPATPAWTPQPVNQASPLADPDDPPKPMSASAMAMAIILFLGLTGLVWLAVIQVVSREKAAVVPPAPIPIRVPAALQAPGEPPATLFDANTAVGVLIIIAVIAGGVSLYFLPSIVANARQHPNFAPIFLINLLTGWSILGWVGALAWALTAIDSRDHHHYHRR